MRRVSGRLGNDQRPGSAQSTQLSGWLSGSVFNSKELLLGSGKVSTTLCATCCGAFFAELFGHSLVKSAIHDSDQCKNVYSSCCVVEIAVANNCLTKLNEKS